MNLEGIYTPVVTPFNAAGEVDYEVFASIIEYVIDGGVSGIVACGTTGESYALSDEERYEVMGFVTQQVNGRVALVAGTNDSSTAKVIKHTQKAKDLGYQAVMLAAPYYALPTQAEIVAHFEEVLAAVDMAIILYNFPGRAGVELEIDTVKALREHSNIVGLKESSGDMSRALALINDPCDGFEVICGSDDQAADYLFWGVRSWIAGGSSVLPKQHADMIKAAKAGDYKQLRAIMTKILPMIQNMESADFNQKAKYGCELAGLSAGETRAPMRPLSAEDKAEFKRVYKLAAA